MLFAKIGRRRISRPFHSKRRRNLVYDHIYHILGVSIFFILYKQICKYVHGHLYIFQQRRQNKISIGI